MPLAMTHTPKKEDELPGMGEIIPFVSRKKVEG